MDRTSSIVLGLIFLIGVAGFFIFLKPNDATAPALTGETLTYTSTAHGFSVSYPANLSHLEYNPDMITIGTITEGGIDGVADLRTFIIETTPDTLVATVAEQLAVYCAADGPTGSFSCSDISRSEPFTTTTGTQGTLVYLHGEHHDLTTHARTPVEKGPYILFPLTMPDAVLVVHAPLNQSAEEADTDLITAIARSVTID